MTPINPFNNTYLSPEDASPESIAAAAQAVFHNNPMLMQTTIDGLQARLAELRERIAKRERKVAVYRTLAGNLGACGFISPGSGRNLFDAAARLQAEEAMLAHYRLVEAGVERLIKLKHELAEVKQ